MIQIKLFTRLHTYNENLKQGLYGGEIMKNKRLLLLLKICMFTGMGLITLGLYFHLFNDTIETMGIRGILISAACVAVGMILSIPTKMVLTFILVNREIKHDLKVKQLRSERQRTKA